MQFQIGLLIVLIQVGRYVLFQILFAAQNKNGRSGSWVALLPETGLYQLFSYLDGKARSIKTVKVPYLSNFNGLNHEDILNICCCAGPICDYLYIDA